MELTTTLNDIPFHIRIKEGTNVWIKKKKYKRAGQLFCSLSTKEHRAFGMKISVFGQTLFLAGSKNERDDVMIVATNHPLKPPLLYILVAGK